MKAVLTLSILPMLTAMSGCVGNQNKDSLPTAAMEAHKPDDPNPAIVCRFGKNEDGERAERCTTPQQRDYEKQSSGATDIEPKP